MMSGLDEGSKRGWDCRMERRRLVTDLKSLVKGEKSVAGVTGERGGIGQRV